MASLIPPLLLGSPPISHEYYDPAEFMEGGPQEADRVDELEYEVSQAARAGPAASLRSQSQDGCLQPISGLAPAASRRLGLVVLPGMWLVTQAHPPSLAELGRARVRSHGRFMSVSLVSRTYMSVSYASYASCASRAYVLGISW